MNKKEKKVVFVGLSGGVDSSVSALRLKNQGYSVVGVFIRVWHPDFLPCNWEAERLDAMRIAAQLCIPFLTCDAELSYKNDVADYFINEYKNGRTPNPDVMCNKYVKFGTFLNFALENGADFIATGHYARVKKDNDGTFLLERGIDETKDQSYFLWTLTQEQLQHTLFPIGDSLKSKVREEAKQAGLKTAQKSDSQGICFLGEVDIPEFLSHYIELKEGVVRNELGKIIGSHRGALVYTIGQRHGFFIATKGNESKPYYVIARDLKENEITVSEQKSERESNSKLLLTDTHYIGTKPEQGEHLSVQTRYRQKPIEMVVSHITKQTLTLTYEKNGEATSTGQSCVLYKGQTTIGGGIISQ